jgi:hypothetical protein
MRHDGFWLNSSITVREVRSWSFATFLACLMVVTEERVEEREQERRLPNLSADR